MSITIRALLTARPAYVPHTPWGPIGALATIAVILLLCLSVLPLCLYLLSSELYLAISGDRGPPGLWSQNNLSPNLGLFQQAAIIGLIWFASGMYGGKRNTVLRLNHPDGGLRTNILLVSWLCVTMYTIAYLLGGVFGQGVAVPKVLEPTLLTPFVPYGYLLMFATVPASRASWPSAPGGRIPDPILALVHAPSSSGAPSGQVL